MGEACNPSQCHNNRLYLSSTSSQAILCPATRSMYPQVDERPIIRKAVHSVKVMRSHCLLPISNMKGVGSIPPPLCQGLHQNGAGCGLQQQTDDRLKAHSAYVALCLVG